MYRVTHNVWGCEDDLKFFKGDYKVIKPTALNQIFVWLSESIAREMEATRLPSLLSLEYG